jgi:peptide/nickel transport system substrate-binding protein
MISKAFVLTVLLLSIVACSNDPDGRVLRFGLSTAPVTLDPRFATDAVSTRINRLLYARLVAFDRSFQPVPALGEWQRLTPEHYRFRLREQGRQFHHGRRMTAWDVRATYESVLDPSTASPPRASLALICRIEVLDEDTLDFYLSKPDPLFPGRLTLGILPAELMAAGHPFNRQPIGSGPYEFVAWPDEGRLRLKRRADAQRLEFVRVADPTVRVLKLLRGEIDMLQNDLPFELVAWLKQRNDIQVRQGPGSNLTYLGFNLQDETVGKRLLREAIAYALDREAIVKYIFGSAARLANALLPPGHWAGHPALVGYPHSLERARECLQEAGYTPDNRLRLLYKTSSDPFRIRLATIIQQQLAKVGMALEIRSYDWGTFYADIKAGRFQIYSLTWVGLKSPEAFHYIFHSDSIPPKGANRGRYINTRADKLIIQSETEPDRHRQVRLYRELQALLLRDLPYVPLWYEDHVFIARQDIQGYVLSPDGNYDGLVSVYRGVSDRYGMTKVQLKKLSKK